VQNTPNKQANNRSFFVGRVIVTAGYSKPLPTVKRAKVMSRGVRREVSTAA
jgi:hypothetical protein